MGRSRIGPLPKFQLEDFMPPLPLLTGTHVSLGTLTVGDLVVQHRSLLTPIERMRSDSDGFYTYSMLKWVGTCVQLSSEFPPITVAGRIS